MEKLKFLQNDTLQQIYSVEILFKKVFRLLTTAGDLVSISRHVGAPNVMHLTMWLRGNLERCSNVPPF